jgi:hypothetical protein
MCHARSGRYGPEAIYRNGKEPVLYFAAGQVPAVVSKVRTVTLAPGLLSMGWTFWHGRSG